jgi:hypothetical protein
MLVSVWLLLQHPPKLVVQNEVTNNSLRHQLDKMGILTSEAKELIVYRSQGAKRPKTQLAPSSIPSFGRLTPFEYPLGQFRRNIR